MSYEIPESFLEVESVKETAVTWALSAELCRRADEWDAFRDSGRSARRQ